MTPVLALLSPAKLNLFLHVTGRRGDGYHTLQTVFQLLDWGDHMEFSPDHGGQVQLHMPGVAVAAEDNLILRAARLLQRGKLGARITCHKRIPIGGGLGGGSSNAATTLLALNHLWELGLAQAELQALGAELGADVPVFVAGHSAWAEGVGDQLQRIALPEAWYLVLKPACSVPTGEIFSSHELTRDTSPITIAAFFQGVYRNDCEPVVVARYPEVGDALQWLRGFAAARLTGTGACVFAAFGSRQEAVAVQKQVPARWMSFTARGIDVSPVLTALA